MAKTVRTKFSPGDTVRYVFLLSNGRPTQSLWRYKIIGPTGSQHSAYHVVPIKIGGEDVSHKMKIHNTPIKDAYGKERNLWLRTDAGYAEDLKQWEIQQTFNILSIDKKK